ncbi:MAG: amidohydrolase family protein [Myxococcota bacterium]
MRRIASVLCLALLLAGASRAEEEPAPPAWTVLHCGALLAVPGEDPLRNVSVVVRGGRIERVVPGKLDPASLPGADSEGTELVDLSDRFVLPGLIDTHVHLTLELGADYRLHQLQHSDAATALEALGRARRTLEAGFTTVRDLGSSGDAVFALRDAIARGDVPGPRILAAGAPITPTGGHGDRTLGFREDLLAAPGPLQGVADGPDECRKAVRAQVKRGADLIKVIATGGVLSQTAAGTDQQFMADELEAVVQTAGLLGRRVAAHAHGSNGIVAALRAGVDSIEHGTLLDDEALELMRGRAFLVPTLLAAQSVGERARIRGFFPPEVVQKALRVAPRARESFSRALAAGVRIAFGTDSGVSPHGENAREFAQLVAAGMREMDAIVAATTNAAALLGLAYEIGTIEPGKAADLIATDGNPLVDISELERVSFVMRAGVIHRRPGP